MVINAAAAALGGMLSSEASDPQFAGTLETTMAQQHEELIELRGQFAARVVAATPEKVSPKVPPVDKVRPKSPKIIAQPKAPVVAPTARAAAATVPKREIPKSEVKPATAEAKTSPLPAEYTKHPQLAQLSDGFKKAISQKPTLEQALARYDSFNDQPAGPRITTKDIVLLARAAGFEGDNLITMVATIRAESGNAPFAINSAASGDHSQTVYAVGLAQILHKAEFAHEDFRDPKANLDPLANLKNAHDLFEARGPEQWEAYTKGMHKKFLAETRMIIKPIKESKPATAKAIKTRIKHFNQDDRRWAKKLYTVTGNKNQTMSSSGCGPTAVAIVSASFGINTNPVKEAKWLIDEEYRTKNNGTKRPGIVAALEAHGLRTERIPATKKAIKKANKNGALVIVSGQDWDFDTPARTQGHYFVVDEMTDKTALVSDPKSRRRAVSRMKTKDALAGVGYAVAVVPTDAQR